jgi:hypothetical protein
VSKNQTEEYFRIDTSSPGEVELESLKIQVWNGKTLAVVGSERLTEGWNPHESLKDFQPKKGEVDFLLKRFNVSFRDHILVEDALKWAFENRLRPAFPSERNAFFLARPDIPTTEDYDWVIDLGSWHLYGDERRYMMIKQSESTKTPTRLLCSTGVRLHGGPHHRCLFVKI